MTAGPDHDPDAHDRELAAAWREHSHERPPSSLDAAILAAAHRAVGARPGKASAEALRPPQWWLPFAAAAVIGVVAVGVVQLAPHESVIDPGSGQAASARMEVATAPASRTEATVAATVRPETGAVPSATPAAPALAQEDQIEARKAAVPGAAEPARPAAALSRGDSRQQGAVVTTPPPPPPPSAPAPAPAPAPMMRAKPDAAPTATPPKVTAPAPAPAAPPMSMPAAPPPMAAAAPAAAPEPFPAARPSAPPEEQAFSRDVPTRGGRIVPMPAELPQKDTAADVGKGIASAPAPAPAPAPALASRAASNESTAVDDRLRESKQKQEAAAPGALAQLAKPSQLAKERVPARAEALEHAKDPEAWIIRIRKLRDGGRTSEAVEELREFDALVPDAQRRMPAELRRFLERENAKR